MKNHFVIPYTGNKRCEVEEIYEHLDLADVETIVEPFCGSSAMSFYIASKNPKKFKYILNDLNKDLQTLYKAMKDEQKWRFFCVMIEIFVNCWNKRMPNADKRRYYKDVIDTRGAVSYFISQKFYVFRSGLAPMSKSDIPKNLNLSFLKAPILSFMKNEDVTVTCGDAVELIKLNKKNHLYLLDPPYVLTNNSFYNSGDTAGDFNVYEYLSTCEPHMNKFLIVEDTWIMRGLFRNGTLVHTYEKNYTGLRKKKSKHIIVLF